MSAGQAAVAGRGEGLSLASPHDLLSVPQTVRRLGMRAGDARAWLAENQLVRRVAGRDRVIWGDVLDAIRRGFPSPVDQPVRVPRKRRRVEAVRRLAKTDAF